jgi:LCP family protein required for cell wall assembly
MVDPAIRRRRIGRIAIVVGSLFLLLLVAGAVGGYFWYTGLDKQIHRVASADPELGLAADEVPPPGKPFFAVLMGSDTRAGEKQQRSDTLMVARIDPQKQTVQLISIPRDTRVNVPGVGMTKINSAAFYGGPKLVIKTVRDFTGLPIKYYVNVSFGGFRDVVDAIGGVWIDVPYAIDDDKASAYGDKYRQIKKGYQKLDGKHAITFVRARHQFADQDFTRIKNQQMFIKALAKQTLQFSNVFRAPGIITVVAKNLDTNIPTSKMIELVLQFRGLKEENLESVSMPGFNSYQDGQSFVEADDQKFTELIDKMKAGERITTTKTKASSSKYRPYQVTVTIRNGAGVSGVAKQAADFLAGKSFPIKDQGNMDQFVYPKTLIVYAKGDKDKANLARELLGFGDVVPSSGMYKFKTDVMVVVGKDWRNPKTASTKLP